MNCKHCGQQIAGDGIVYLHMKNGYTGKVRCDPEKTGQPYGLEAEPEEQE